MKPTHFFFGLLLLFGADTYVSPDQAEASGRQIPVLCYHSFYSIGEDGSPGSLDESYEGFEELLQFLQESGYRSYVPGIDRTPPGPDPQKVVITFDDGHRSQLKAAELLEKYYMRGIFFVIPELIDEPGYPHMTSEELASLAERGHFIAAHGYRHKSMPVTGPEIVATLDTVPNVLEPITERSATDLHSLAFPFGHYTPAIEQAMRGQYPFQYTVNPGYWNGHSTLIPRVLMVRDTDRQFYYDYLQGRFAGRQSLTMQEANGSRQSVLRFDNPEQLDPASLYIQAATPDYDYQHYSTYSAKPFMKSEGDVLVFDIVEYLETRHSIERRALSFAVLHEKDGVSRYVSDGYLIWVKKRE